MDLGLNGKKVLITGATRGIGRAIAEAFAGEGAHIAFCARNAQNVMATEQALRDAGANCFGTALDIGDHTRLRKWVEDCANRMGGLDILIANPSAFGIGTSLDDWRAGFDVDLMGTVHALDAATPFLLAGAEQNGDAAVLIVSSALAAETETDSAYGAYKAALIHFAKGAARRLAAKGVRVNSVSPGTIYVEDGFWGNAQRNMPEVYQHFFQRNPMQRMGCPREVAKPALFLCSPAASFITGANLLVDGGFTQTVQY